KTKLSEQPLLVAVVGDVDDDVKSACWAIGTDVMLITLQVTGGMESNLIVTPTVVLETTQTERLINEPKSEKDHFDGKEHMKPLYDELIIKLRKELDSNIKINPSPQNYIGIINRKSFGEIYIKKKRLQLYLLMSPNEEEQDDEDITPHRNGSWSFIDLSEEKDLTGKKWNWIKRAYTNAS
ncbi:MAG TPA: DUF5655 domain-containing protein, partial [Candidatus Nanoarchaeia archaeon]|nr:DUF5655 domain-containing protein [Candidatus Nanoarchaeia archaeon]